MAQNPSCPNCGEPLVAVENPGPETPPWLSPGCARGWWPIELTGAARQAWDPLRREHKGRHGRNLRKLLEDPDARQGGPRPPARDGDRP